MTRAELLSALKALSSVEFEAIVFTLEVPDNLLSNGAAQTTRAMEVIRYLEGKERRAELEACLQPPSPPPEEKPPTKLLVVEEPKVPKPETQTPPVKPTTRPPLWRWLMWSGLVLVVVLVAVVAVKKMYGGKAPPPGPVPGPETGPVISPPTKPAKTKLAITSVPIGAKVTVNKKEQGTTTKGGLTVEVDYNEQTKVALLVELDGYKPQTVNVLPNKADIVVPTVKLISALPTAAECTGETGNANFFKCPDGSIHDKTGKLIWAEKDNRGNVSYDEARAYVRRQNKGRKNDWRMPTISELKALRDAKVTTLNEGKLINLGTCCVWAGDAELPTGVGLAYDCLTHGTCSGSPWAFFVRFSTGTVQRQPRSLIPDMRVLLVRSSGN